MTRLYLARHGRAAAGWNVDPDPGLDAVGVEQAEAMAARLRSFGPLAIVSSPLLRCRQTAAALAVHWDVVPRLESRLAEIPSPEGVPMAERVEWLRGANRKTWTELGERYVAFRDGVTAALLEIVEAGSDTVVTSHFTVINSVIGTINCDDRVLIRSLNNCSVTVVDYKPAADGSAGMFQLVEVGDEADTLIR